MEVLSLLQLDYEFLSCGNVYGIWRLESYMRLHFALRIDCMLHNMLINDLGDTVGQLSRAFSESRIWFTNIRGETIIEEPHEPVRKELETFPNIVLRTQNTSHKVRKE